MLEKIISKVSCWGEETFVGLFSRLSSAAATLLAFTDPFPIRQRRVDSIKRCLLVIPTFTSVVTLVFYTEAVILKCFQQSVNRTV